MDDDMSLIYNVNLCRICQIPGKTDVIVTSQETESGQTHLDLLKFIFCEIIWIEDDFLSVACQSCLNQVSETAEFKRLCLETNRRRSTVNLNHVKLEGIDLVKLEITPDIDDTKSNATENDNVLPEVQARTKMSVVQDATAVDLENNTDFARIKIKRKKKPTRIKVLKTKKITKRPKQIKSDSEYEDNVGLDEAVNDDIMEDIENNVVDQNIVTDTNLDEEGKSKENIKKMSQYVPQYNPSGFEKACRVCKRKFKSRQKLKEHIKSNHLKLRQYCCAVCNMGFIGRDALNRHMYKHNGARNYICTICGHKYITQGDLTNHLERHAEELKYSCDICPNKRFKTYSSLRTHRIIVHTDPKDFKYLCTECGSKFPTSGGLKVHMLRHKKVRNFTCHMCDKSFCTKAEMQRHTATHSNMRPHKCDLCPAEYKHKNILLVHKTKRHGIGNYKYKIEKKYECSYCEKKIVSKDKLERHIRTHTGVKPYKCRLCDQKFICKSYIKGHMRGKHEINVDAADYDTKLYYDVCAEIAQIADTTAVLAKTDNQIDTDESTVKK